MPKSSNRQPPCLDARLSAAAAYVRPGRAAADIGCDHGKLSAWLAGSGRCPRVFACDLRPGPLAKARQICAPWADAVECRLGSGLSVLAPGEASEIVIAGMGAETILDILDAAAWVRSPAYNLILVPATKHSLLRLGLSRRGFALKGETLCQAAGRWYTVINARFTGQCQTPDAWFCLTGLTGQQPGFAGYLAQQYPKVEKYRRGLDPGPQADAVDKLLARLRAMLAPPANTEKPGASGNAAPGKEGENTI